MRIVDYSVINLAAPNMGNKNFYGTHLMFMIDMCLNKMSSSNDNQISLVVGRYLIFCRNVPLVPCCYCKHISSCWRMLYKKVLSSKISIVNEYMNNFDQTYYLNRNENIVG